MVFHKLRSFGNVRETAAAFAIRLTRLSRLASVLVFVLLAASCSGDSKSTPVGLGRSGISSLRFAPRYSSIASASAFAPINRIHLAARVVGTGVVVADTTFDNVDPNAASWPVTIDVDLSGGADIVVLITLINVTNGVAAVQWSGETPPLHVTPGSSNTPAPVTLFPGPPENLSVTSVAITRPVPSVIEGQTLQLNATVSGGGATTQVFWSAINPAVATISNTGLVTTLIAGSARLVASAGPRSDTVTVNVGQRVTRVEVTPATLTLEAIRAETDFTARVLDPRGAVIPGATVVWRSLNPTVAEQVTGGRFRSLSTGIATIEAASADVPTVVGQAILTVSQRVATVELTPPTATINSIGGHATFTAVAKDVSGAVITGAVFTFTSSAPGIATITNAGVATSLTNGATTITAMTPLGGAAPSTATVSATSTLNVNQTAATIELTATPDVIDAIGGNSVVVAVGRDASGNTVPGSSFTYSSTNPGVLAVDPTTGRVTALTAGQASIRATSGTASATVQISVEQRVTIVSLTPTSFTATSIGQTQQFTATARDRNRNPVPGRAIAWSLSAPGVASVSTTGLATALTQGSTNVIATVEGVTAQAGVSVTQAVSAIVVTPSPRNFNSVGDTARFQASARDSNGNTIPGKTFVWSSSNTGVVTIDATGLAHSIGAGTSTITATSDGQSGTATANVIQVTSGIQVTPANKTFLVRNDTARFTAVARDAHGNVIAGKTFTWSSSNSTFVSINASTGLATALAAGSVTITATADGQTGTATATVNPTVNSVAVSPSATTIAVGDTVHLTATARDAGGNTVSGKTFTWLSSNPSIATVNSSGRVTAIANGSAVISATTDDISGSANITVGSVVIDGTVEHFPDPLGGWRTRFLGLYSNLVNYYLTGVGGGSGQGENYRGNNADGLWISDGNTGDGSSLIRFTAQFAAQLTGFSLDVGSHVNARIKIYDKDLHVIFTDTILPTGCSNCASHEGPGSGNHYVTFAVTSSNGIGGFDIIGSSVEGNLGIDNVIISTSPSPDPRFSRRVTQSTARMSASSRATLPNGVNAADVRNTGVRSHE